MKKIKKPEPKSRKKVCRHRWYDGGKSSTISYSKCLKCGETVYY